MEFCLHVMKFISIKVQWEFKETNNQFQPYPADINIKLEKAHSSGGENTVEWEEEDIDGNVIKCTVDLKSMKETDGRITRDVQRRVLAAKGEFYRMDRAFKYNLMLILNGKSSSYFPAHLYYPSCNRIMINLNQRASYFAFTHDRIPFQFFYTLLKKG